MRKRVFDNEKKFNKNYNIIGDFELVMRMSEKYNFLANQEPLAQVNSPKQFFKFT